MKLLQDNKIKNSINDVNKLELPSLSSVTIDSKLITRSPSILTDRNGMQVEYGWAYPRERAELSTAHLSYRDTARHSFNHSRRVSMGNQPHTPMTMTAQARGADRYRLFSPSVSYFGTAGNGLHFIQVW